VQGQLHFSLFAICCLLGSSAHVGKDVGLWAADLVAFIFLTPLLLLTGLKW
jgi:hypothetical protein